MEEISRHEGPQADRVGSRRTTEARDGSHANVKKTVPTAGLNAHGGKQKPISGAEAR
jgi:hypothetical protein